jgi:hypothetical protein
MAAMTLVRPSSTAAARTWSNTRCRCLPPVTRLDLDVDLGQREVVPSGHQKETGADHGVAAVSGEEEGPPWHGRVTQCQCQLVH